MRLFGMKNRRYTKRFEFIIKCYVLFKDVTSKGLAKHNVKRYNKNSSGGNAGRKKTLQKTEVEV